MGTSAVVRGTEQCCFNSFPDPFNSILKPPKVIESKTYVKKACGPESIFSLFIHHLLGNICYITLA